MHGWPTIPTLAQTVSPETLRQVYIWVGVLALVMIVSSVILMVVRRRTQQQAAAERGPVFTLADLRRMHEEGQLSDEEFERLKRRIIGETRLGGASRQSSVASDAAREEAPPAKLPDPPAGSNGEGE